MTAAPALLDDLLAADAVYALELDLGWAWYAGADPVSRLGHPRPDPARPHEGLSDARRAFAPVGDGSRRLPTGRAAAIAAGAEWLLVEQDETEGPSLDAARRSFDGTDRDGCQRGRMTRLREWASSAAV